MTHRRPAQQQPPLPPAPRRGHHSHRIDAIRSLFLLATGFVALLGCEEEMRATRHEADRTARRAEIQAVRPVADVADAQEAAGDDGARSESDAAPAETADRSGSDLAASEPTGADKADAPGSGAEITGIAAATDEAATEPPSAPPSDAGKAQTAASGGSAFGGEELRRPMALLHQSQAPGAAPADAFAADAAASEAPADLSDLSDRADAAEAEAAALQEEVDAALAGLTESDLEASEDGQSAPPAARRNANLPSMLDEAERFADVRDPDLTPDAAPDASTANAPAAEAADAGSSADRRAMAAGEATAPDREPGAADREAASAPDALADVDDGGPAPDVPAVDAGGEDAPFATQLPPADFETDATAGPPAAEVRLDGGVEPLTHAAADVADREAELIREFLEDDGSADPLAANGDPAADAGDDAPSGDMEEEAATAAVEEAPDAAPSPAEERMSEELRRDLVRRRMRKVQAARLVDRAEKLFGGGEYEAALELFEEAEQLDPDNVMIAQRIRETRTLAGPDDREVEGAIVERIGETEAVRRQLDAVEVRAYLDRAELLLEDARTVTPEEEALHEPSERLSRSLGKARDGLESLERADLLLRGALGGSPARTALREKSEALRAALTEERDRLRDALNAISQGRALDLAKENQEEQQSAMDRKLQKLVESVEFHEERREYGKALELAEQIIDLDPTFEKGTELRDSLRVKEYNAKALENARKLERNEEHIVLDVNEMAIAETELIVYPDDWERVMMRSRGVRAEAAREPWKQQIIEMLETNKITLEFDGLPLGDVLTYIQDQSGVNIVRDQTVDPSVPVTISVRDMTLGRALDWILRLTNLHRELRDEVIYISDQPKSEVVMQLYPIYDLTHEPSDYVGPTATGDDDDDDGGAGDISGLFGGDDDDDDDAFGGAGAQTGGGIIEKIKESIAPESWEEDRVTINIWNDNLLVLQTPAVHQQITEYLTRLRETQKKQVLVEGRFITVVEDFIEQIGFNWYNTEPETTAFPAGKNIGGGWNAPNTDAAGAFPNGSDPNRGHLVPANLPSGMMWGDAQSKMNPDHNPTDPQPNHALIYGFQVRPGVASPNVAPDTGEGGLKLKWKYISAEPLHNYEINAILEAVRKNRKGSILHNPRLLVSNGRNAFMEVSTTSNYISGYDTVDGYVLPTIDEIRQGVVFDVRPVISFDKKYVTIRLRPSMSEFDAVNTRPRLVAVQTRVSGDTDGDGGGGATSPIVFEILNPQIRRTRIWTHATVPDGGTAMIGGLIRDARKGATSGVPLLSDLPYLGRLMRSETRDRAKSNLILMVKATIIELRE